MLTSPRAVLFDAGGTLVVPEGGRIAATLTKVLALEAGLVADVAATRLALARATRELDEHHWRAGEPIPGHDLVRSLLRHLGVPAASLDAAADVVLALAAEDYGIWNDPLPGARETVVELRHRGFRVAVVSNSDGRAAEHLARAGIEPSLFECIVDSHEVGVEKPDPGIFRVALELLGLEAHECAYVGDVWFYDVQGAVAAGLAAVLIDPADLYGELHDHVRIPDVTALLTLPWLSPLP